MRSRLILLLHLIVALSCCDGARASDWTREALRLTGESKIIRERAMHNLLKIPHLKSMLRHELMGSRRSLALDVISSLGFEDFLPELLQLAKTDASGIFYLSIDALLTAQNQKMIAGIYRQRLLCAKPCGISPAVQVLLLDTLGQIGERLSYQELKQIFDGSWYEVKAAVLNYTRLFLLRGEPHSYLPIIDLCLDSPILQLRWQAIYLIAELPNLAKSEMIKSLKKCSLLKDPRTPPDVSKLCLRLVEGEIK